MMFRRSAALAAAVLLAGAPALAQTDPAPPPAKPARPAATLKEGDKAPALNVDKWVKGEPITGFEKGRVYVVEFWATWCGPCIMSMPHLSALQKEYKEKGVTLIGVNIWEEYGEGTPAQIDAFVKDQGDRMAYTVAYDGPARKTDEAYMKAAGRNGIPSSFLVDQNGVIAWIGHPGQLDVPLAEVVAGTWDIKTGPEKVRKISAAYGEAARLMQTDARAGLEAWNKVDQEYPVAARAARDRKWMALLKARLYDDAYAVMSELTDEAIAQRNGTALNNIAWSIVDPNADVEKKDLDLALRAASKADEFTNHKDAPTIDTLALVYFLKGDVNKAVELQQKAFDLADEQMKEELGARLEQFKKAAGKG